MMPPMVSFRGLAVVVPPGGHLDTALRALKKLMQQERVLSDIARHEGFISKSVRRRSKSARARKKQQC